MKLRILTSIAIAAAALAGCSQATTNQFRVFPPDAADKNVNNAAYMTGKPYGDDCWQYGFGCGPPGTNPNIHIGGPYYNPARPVYVVEYSKVAPDGTLTRRLVLRHPHGRSKRHRRPD